MVRERAGEGDDLLLYHPNLMCSGVSSSIKLTSANIYGREGSQGDHRVLDDHMIIEMLNPFIHHEGKAL